MELVAIIFAALVATALIAETAYRVGHSNGYCKGMAEASGWRDETIEKYKAMVTESLRQRDNARAYIAKAPPNPFAIKDVN
jgi:hypothetical protein